MSLDQSLAVAANSLCVVAFLAPDAVSATKISEQLSVNPVVIRRAVGKLVAAGLVKSLAGANGGYVLARSPEDISLQDIFTAISEKGIFERANATPRATCVGGEAISNAIISTFKEAETAFAQVLKDTTVDYLLSHSKRP